jgi:diguanylate cyclase (GGDEF)-like protein
VHAPHTVIEDQQAPFRVEVRSHVVPGAGRLALITRDLADRTGADSALLMLQDGETEPLELVATWDVATGAEGPPSLSPEADGLVQRVLYSGQAVVEGDGAGALVRTPAGQVGALCAFYRGAAGPASMLWVVESYARLASLLLHDPNMLRGLVEKDRLDSLTGCLRYGALHEELEREIHRSDRHRRSLSCCFIDLDRFKAINERHGHLHGSRVLAAVGARLREEMRDGDVLGRYGGDEFVALLPDTDEREAWTVAERLRTGIASAGPSGLDDRIDASIGISQWVHGSSAEELLTTADDALRSAKAAGGGATVRATQLRLKGAPGGSPGKRGWA